MRDSELIYGINPVREGLESRLRPPLELFLQRRPASSRLAELAEVAVGLGLPVRHLDKPELDRLAGHPRHQGALLRVKPFAYAPLEAVLSRWRASGQRAFLLVLDGITDPHNLGAIVRSAEAAGCHGLLMPKDRACPVTSVVDKVSAGALAHLPLCQVTNLARTLDLLKQEGLWVFGLAGEESAHLFRADLRVDLALVLGSEGSGLRPNVRKHCDLLLSIPLAGRMNSLNASVAAGVAMFEVLRQRSAA